jgi:hypothetical protein
MSRRATLPAWAFWEPPKYMPTVRPEPFTFTAPAPPWAPDGMTLEVSVPAGGP